MIGLTNGARWSQRAFVAVAFTALFAVPAAAQSNNAAQPNNVQSDHDLLSTETYVRPPSVVDRIIMAPRTDISFTQPSPDRKWFLKSPGLDRGDVAQFGKPHIYLGGVQVDAHANRARSLTNSQHDENDRNTEGSVDFGAGLVALGRAGRVHRKLRRCVADLRGGRGDWKISAGFEDAAAGDTRDDG
jgi:hypothetical protein